MVHLHILNNYPFYDNEYKGEDRKDHLLGEAKVPELMATRVN